MLKRAIKRHGSYIALVGIVISFSILLYLNLCSMSCDDKDRKRAADEQESRSLPSPLRKGFLVVLIMTGPKYADRRDVIRNTWLSSEPTDTLHYFSIGTEGLSKSDLQTLEEENDLNKDLMLLPNFKDSYHLLTLKLILSLKWLEENVDYKFLLKADDDTFARLDILHSELRESTDSEDLYWGFFTGRARVKKSGKWAEPGWVICDNYLPYARGGGYVLSANLARFITRNAEYLRQFNSEDVSLGAWLGPLKISRVHDPRFDTEYKSRGCNNRYVVTHKQDIESMKQLHENLRTSGKLCTKEHRRFYSYVYNWKVAPSQCCIRNDTSVP